MTKTQLALHKAIEASIREVGIATFKATSMFMSSSRRIEVKEAA